MKRVSSQTRPLSSSQRRQLELQARMRAIQSPLRAQVDETLAELDKRKEEGAKPEKVWTHESTTRSAPSIAEWMGY